jgi:DNA invertase Pin-like site-specific DNA recombinase
MATRGPFGAALFVAYYRVSTDKQGRSGLGLDAQKATVGQYVASAAGNIIAEFQEVESGKRRDRPQLALALGACRARRATLIIAKLDRLARDAAFLLSIVRGAGEAGLVFCDLPQLPPGPAGTFILTMFAAVAELERGLVSQRTTAALAAAKARGVRLGGRRIFRGIDGAVSRAGREAQTARATEHRADVLPYISAAQKAGANSLRDIARALTAPGHSASGRRRSLARATGEPNPRRRGKGCRRGGAGEFTVRARFLQVDSSRLGGAVRPLGRWATAAKR